MPSASTIVLVDDDDAVLHSLRFALELEGFTVRAFSSGDALLERPDIAAGACLVIDYTMPGLNGLDLLRVLREHGVSAPAILMTGDPTPAFLMGAAIAGATVLEKPALGDLGLVVRRLLAQRKGRTTPNGDANGSASAH
ncbi:MAG: response regulator [Alphaproteobacteria bacterium]|nr:response regulator [Alphaproteobacteria bacterium]